MDNVVFLLYVVCVGLSAAILSIPALYNYIYIYILCSCYHFNFVPGHGHE